MVEAGNLQLVPKVTFEATPKLKKLMEEHPEVNWSSVFRQAIERQARASEIARQILEEESDPRIQRIAELVTRGAARRFEEARRRANRN